MCWKFFFFFWREDFPCWREGTLRGHLTLSPAGEIKCGIFWGFILKVLKGFTWRLCLNFHSFVLLLSFCFPHYKVSVVNNGGNKAWLFFSIVDYFPLFPPPPFFFSSLFLFFFSLFYCFITWGQYAHILFYSILFYSILFYSIEIGKFIEINVVDYKQCYIRTRTADPYIRVEHNDP